jgi:molecular chaperone GrpE
MTEPIQPDATEKTQATPPTTPAPADAGPSKLEEQLTVAKQEAATNYDRYTRAVADLENFRKRALREKEELRLYALSGLLEDVIPILDNLGLGLAAAKQQTDVQAIVGGVSMTLEQFKTTLARHGLKEVNPANQKFDPHFHECISHQPSAEVAEEHVMQVVRLGYTLNNRLLRPASVIVSSGSAKETKA